MARHDDLLTTHFTKCTPRKDHRGVDLISDALQFDRLWYGSQTQSVTQSTSPSFAADHTTL
jgi:hypothetical protein